MPSNETARERVAEAIWDTGTVVVRYRDAGHMEEFQKETRLEADAAIAAYNAWLWEQAERPEVVEAVALGMEGFDSFIDREHRAQSIAAAEVFLPIALAALIGPRPQGESDER